ncbi:MAG: hypothetical protein ABEJ72_08545, partial [Candidatus Aenigmatarchaeota archaeon]
RTRTKFFRLIFPETSQVRNAEEKTLRENSSMKIHLQPNGLGWREICLEVTTNVSFVAKLGTAGTPSSTTPT